MEEEKRMQESSKPGVAGDPLASEGRLGPSWRGWVLSILVAIILSVTATLLLGGSFAFRPERAAATEAAGSGCGSGGNCCPLEGR